jgi:hypothetical protein
LSLVDCLTIALISLFPASFEALTRLSPATISYSPGATDGTTIIGWIRPCLFIEFASSLSFSSLNFFLGWNLLGLILFIGFISTNSFLFNLFYVGINDSKPLPNAFFCIVPCLLFHF